MGAQSWGAASTWLGYLLLFSGAPFILQPLQFTFGNVSECNTCTGTFWKLALIIYVLYVRQLPDPVLFLKLLFPQRCSLFSLKQSRGTKSPPATDLKENLCRWRIKFQSHHSLHHISPFGPQLTPLRSKKREKLGFSRNYYKFVTIISPK